MAPSQKRRSWRSPNRIVTPWYNREEFDEVAAALYSDNIIEMRWGLRKVEMWKLRTRPAPLPVVIDATEALVSAVLQDKLYKKRIVFGDEFGVRLMFAQALVRFINLIAENEQDKSISLRETAGKLNIPGWIVDLRHSAAHSRLPPVGQLRHGVMVALKFLKEKHWQEKHIPIPNSDCENISSIVLRRLINAYKVQHLHNLRYIWKSKQEKNISCKEILDKLESLLKKNSSGFFNQLLRPNIFFLTDTELKDFLSDDEIPEGFDLPIQVLDLWKPLVEVINSAHQIPQFVAHLLECQKSLQPYYQKSACAWAYKLIKLVLDNANSSDTWDPIHAVYTKKKWCFDWFFLTSICIANPSVYVTAILQMVLPRIHPPLPPSSKSAIISMFSLYLGAVPLTDSDQVPSKLYTWMDAQEDSLLQQEPENEQLPNLWKEAPDNIDWETIPIGHVFGSTSAFIKSLPEIKSEVKEKTCTDTNAKPASNIPNESQHVQSSSKGSLTPTSSGSTLVSLKYMFTEDCIY